MTTGKNFQTTQANIYFICSPSLGILDHWLPTIFSLREQAKASHFVFVVPRTRTVKEINLENRLIEIAGTIFDEIVFLDSRGNWRQSKSFSEAKSIAGPRLAASTGRVTFRQIAAFLGHLDLTKKIFGHFATNRKPIVKQPAPSLSRILRPENSVVLFDISEANQEYLRPVLTLLKGAPKFSLPHGIASKGLLYGQTKSNEKPAPTPHQIQTENALTTSFLLSTRERAFYKQAYGLNENQLHLTGIPMHEKKWVEKISDSSGTDTARLSREFIFVISRPSTTSYLPRSRKLEAIRDIKKVAETHDLFVVVKAHPKETDDGTFHEVFGSEKNGATWATSLDHPFVLGKHCAFAVSFYSGVAVDMVMLGTPVIERLDLRGLPDYDDGDALRDETGDPVFPYRFLGLVLGASSSAEFLAHVAEILSNRKKVVQTLQARYRSVFPTIDGVNEKISSQILESLRLETK